MAKRDRSIDVLRGLGMLFVIIGHMYSGPWVRYIFSFHMPLFFFLSGFSLAKKEDLDAPLVYLRRKCRTILLPYVVFFFLCLALNDLAFAPEGGLYLKVPLIAGAVAKALVLSGGRLNDIPLYNFPLWFLPHLFVLDLAAYALMRLGRCLPDRNVRRAGAAALCAALIAVTLPVQALLPGRPALHINVLPASLAFWLLGWLCEPLTRTGVWTRWAPRLCPLLLFMGYVPHAVNGGGNISNILSVTYYLGALCSILGYYSLCQRLRSPLLTYIGRNAIVFLGLHMPVIARCAAIPRPAWMTLDAAYHAVQVAAVVAVLTAVSEGWGLVKRAVHTGIQKASKS